MKPFFDDSSSVAEICISNINRNPYPKQTQNCISANVSDSFNCFCKIQKGLVGYKHLILETRRYK